MARSVVVTMGVLADRAKRAAAYGDLALRKKVLDQATLQTCTSQNQVLDLDGMRAGSAAFGVVTAFLALIFTSTVVLF